MMDFHHIMMLIHHKLYDSYKLYYCLQILVLLHSHPGMHHLLASYFQKTGFWILEFWILDIWILDINFENPLGGIHIVDALPLSYYTPTLACTAPPANLLFPKDSILDSRILDSRILDSGH